MKIARIVIRNIRGFRLLDFRLDHGQGAYDGWTVFTGDNGSGKTSLLKSIALTLNGPVLARVLQPSLRGWVRKGEGTGSIRVEIVAEDEDAFKGTAGQRPKRLTGEVEITNQDREPVLSAKTQKGKGPSRGPWYSDPEGWFSCGYGPFRRMYGESADAQRVMVGPGPIARFATMFREDASLIECERWLKDQKMRSLEGDVPSTYVLDVVEKLLNDDFLQNEMKVAKIDSEGLWLEDASSLQLPLADMSDGYRSATALLVDILRHMVSVYRGAGITREAESGNWVVGMPGVVLIDEIDSHLHPDWQRKIGFWLKRKFPRVQFIVTTHSPLICQAADPKGLFYLPAPGSGDAPYQLTESDCRKVVNGKPDTILLSPAFNLKHTRSPKVVQAQGRHAELLAKAKALQLSQQEKTELKDIETQLGFLPFQED